MGQFSDAELRVVLMACRQTFGWQRDKAKMSISFLAKGTGMSGGGVLNAIKSLLQNGLMERSPEGDSFSYSVTITEPTQQTPLNGVGTPPLNGVYTPPLNGVGTNKEKLLKKEKTVFEGQRPLQELPAPLQDAKFLVAWHGWVDDRKARGKKMTVRAADLQLAKCARWGCVKSIEAINNSIASGWQGLFEPKVSPQFQSRPAFQHHSRPSGTYNP